MSAKRFHVFDPEQLKAIEAFITDGSIDNLYRIWNYYRSTGKGRIWNNAIFISFSGDRMRRANVVKVIQGDERTFANLKYNLALRWCQRNLREESA